MLVFAPSLALAAACGGGEVTSAPAERPVPTAPSRSLPLPQTTLETLGVLDSVPASGATVAPGAVNISVAHLAPMGLAFSPSGDCRPTGVTLRRAVMGLSGAAPQQLMEHHLRCELAPLAAHELAIEDGDGRYRAELRFATGADPGPASLVVQDARTVPRQDVNELFDAYVSGALAEQLAELGADVTAVIRAAIGQVAEQAWGELTNPNAAYDVVAQHVAYSSRTPRGEPDAQLTGLIAMPDAGLGSFTRKSRVILLSHASGSTPSSLEASDSWFMLAAMLAGRGHLVIAPDNWGRGGQQSGPETYLIGNRVANNSVDLLRIVLASEDYSQFLPPEGPADLSIIGYSQGGHSALAVWLALHTAEVGATVRELYSGGAPHNLYQTVIGALEALADRCDGNRWCRDVGEDAIRTYVIGRAVPAFLAYTDIGLAEEDVLVDGALAPDFLRGMLETDSRFDNAKALLQLNSFTNFIDLGAALPASATRIHLYHSEFDLLVPERNTGELAELLEPAFGVTYHDDECSSDEYRVLAGLVRNVVGAIHTLCGLEMLDEALQGLDRLSPAGG